MAIDDNIIRFPRPGAKSGMSQGSGDPAEEDRARASREAIDWLVVLNDDPDDAATRAHFQDWLSVSAVNRAAWQHHERTYDLLSHAPATTREHWRGAGKTSPRATVRRRRVIAAAVAACLAVLVTPAAWLRLSADRITQTAEIGRERLPDGSIAILAPDSAIAIAYSASGREIRLLKGEAFFDVVRDRKRPFRVIAGAAQTTVLGTAFDVRLRAAGVRVAVMRGKVQVARRGGNASAAPLGAGDWTYLPSGGARETGRQPASMTSSWTSGRLMIDDRHIDEAIDEIRPWFAGKIIVADRALAGRQVTGTVDLRDPAEAVRSLVGVHGGSVRRITPWLLVVY